jgi:hypothetical protein
MNVEVWTAHNGRFAKAATRHEPEFSLLRITDPDGHTVQIFGPAGASDAFDKMAALFNEAHKAKAVGEAA